MTGLFEGSIPPLSTLATTFHPMVEKFSFGHMGEMYRGQMPVQTECILCICPLSFEQITFLIAKL